MTLGEKDVYLANLPFIKSLVHKYARGFPEEDAFMIVSVSFLLAIRTYRCSCGLFHHYADTVVQDYVQDLRRKESNRLKIESGLSLDQPISLDQSRETIGSAFFPASGDFTDDFCIQLFLESLPPDLYNIAIQLIENPTADVADLDMYRRDLQKRWEKFNQ